MEQTPEQFFDFLRELIRSQSFVPEMILISKSTPALLASFTDTSVTLYCYQVSTRELQNYERVLGVRASIIGVSNYGTDIMFQLPFYVFLQ